MRKWMILLGLVWLLHGNADAMDLTAPEAPPSASMPANTQSFPEAVLEILSDAAVRLRPDLKEAAAACMGVLAGVVILSLCAFVPGHEAGTTELVGTIAVAGILFGSTNALIRLGADTVSELSDYGKLLLPVMSAALAAQGGITTAAALHTATAVFDAVLCSVIARALVPMIYLYLALAVGCAALDDTMLKKLRDGIRQSAAWCLKTILYVYTGYIGVSGVVSGSTDAGLLKATKLTISGVVPVVGGILSDASEAVLISAGTMKNAAGIYGMIAVLAVWIGPFIRIGCHYLILKFLSFISAAFDIKPVTQIIGDFSAAMGLVLAMTGAVCLMLLISTVCFMKGVGL